MKYKFSPLYNEVTTADDLYDVGGPPVEETSPPPVEPTEQPVSEEEPPPSPPPLTRDDLAETIKALQPAPTPTPISQEEQDAQLQRYRPNQELISTLLDNEQTMENKVAALEDMTQGIFRYSSNAANQLAMHHVEELRKELSPALSVAQQQQAESWKGEFYGAYPTFKGQGNLIEAAAARLKSAGSQPKNKTEAFQMLAKSAETIAKEINPNFGQTTSRMASTSTGGQGGGVPTGQAATKGGCSDIW